MVQKDRYLAVSRDKHRIEWIGNREKDNLSLITTILVRKSAHNGFNDRKTYTDRYYVK